MIRKNVVHRREVAVAVTVYGRSSNDWMWKVFPYFFGNDIRIETEVTGQTTGECDSVFDPLVNYVQPGLSHHDRRGLIR